MRKVYLYGGFVIATEVVWQLYKILRDFRKCKTHANTERNVTEQGSNFTEVMFFSQESGQCLDHVAEDPCSAKTCPVRYLRQLESYINGAKNSLDVCMYLLTSHTLSKAFISSHKRGVHVRVIMDQHMARNESAHVASFHNNGIEIRMQRTDVLMHHKFVVVDKQILIHGSANWTMSAFFGNFENILVTNQTSLVTPFEEQFQRLWADFQPPADKDSPAP
ncbi:mitochondrial cardiolipin hydrolase zuc [Lasioglossum baleicum]|uniref:mitochondrial cardiolipin hydrolase zuc n=1 Tax=Lasioglossum baleicum TaxID=434251 RepID=UPI003FCE7F23